MHINGPCNLHGCCLHANVQIFPPQTLHCISFHPSCACRDYGAQEAHLKALHLQVLLVTHYRFVHFFWNNVEQAETDHNLAFHIKYDLSRKCVMCTHLWQVNFPLSQLLLCTCTNKRWTSKQTEWGYLCWPSNDYGPGLLRCSKKKNTYKFWACLLQILIDCSNSSVAPSMSARCQIGYKIWTQCFQ